MAQDFKIFQKQTPRVFSIEPYENFLQILATNFSKEILGDEFQSDAIILLPTRRAARQLANEFLDARFEAATILPRIRTIGDIDPEEIDLAGLGGYLDFEPHISQQRKIFELAKLVQARNVAADWSNDANNAINGAFALADLLDSAELMAQGGDGPDWSKLDDLVDEIDMAEHWKKSQEFLKIITQYWPQKLKELGLCDPANKRRRAIETLTQTWEENPPDFPVIIAGSTGSVPAVRDLMRVVCRLPKGCVILPGLDKNMKPENWAKLAREDGHPQRILFDTINKLGISRDEVVNLTSRQDDALLARRKILNLALSPKEATASWIIDTQELGQEATLNALSHLTLIEAETEEDEAEAIALHMRECLEHEEKTCALISPNQNIAHRVCQKMQKWGIEIDISSGIPLPKTDIGVYFELVCDWVLSPSDPKSLMAILAHPFAKFGLEFIDKKHGMIGLELGLLRGAARDKDLNDLLARANSLKDKDWHYKRAGRDKTIKLIQAIKAVFDGLETQMPDNLSIGEIARFLVNCAELIAKDESQKFEFIWGKEAGAVGAGFFSQLINDGADFNVKSLAEGFKIIKNLMAKNVVRPKMTHPNLAILGPLEARLIHFDKYILAGLDEGIWPQPAPIDPFLSRPMRAKLGLQSKDLRLGLAAHDFSQLAANENVILTRAARRNGAPSVPSRWLWRLKTLVAGALGENISNLKIASHEFDALKINEAMAVKYIDNVSKIVPKPTPPEFARPKEYSATQIESLIRDPYKIYVTKVLGLLPLDPLGGEISAKERGSAIHKAMEIIKDWQKIPDDAFELLMAEFAKQLLAFGYDEEMMPLELERLKASAQLMVDFQKARENEGFKINVEKRVLTQLETKSATFTLKATADRIDVDANGNGEIWDYKTGGPPSDAQISTLMSPQLPVTAWILQKENDVSLRHVTKFGHIHIGNKKPKIMEYEGKQNGTKETLSMPECIEKTDRTLKILLEKFNSPSQMYLSKPRVEFLHKNQSWEDLTDRLARRAEWADNAGGDDE